MSAISEAFRHKLGTLKGGRIELRKDEEEGIATIVLNFPEKRNSFTGSMMLELESVIAELECWSRGKGVLLHGAKGFFCSGGYLAHMKKISRQEEGVQMATLMRTTLNRLGNLRMLTVAVVEGRALGGGAELTTATDFRLMARGSEVQFVHAKMGIAPAWGGATNLVKLVGHQQALDLLTSCRRLGAEEAVKMHYAIGVLNSDDAVPEARKWLRERTQWPVEVVRTLKEMVSAARTLPVSEAHEKELQLFAPLWGATANRDALIQNIKH
ncbi:ethylmalonyl-CoA decarboxylase-like [Ornithodoros turicata]|uniref:ethylmalonyl-CoA decarboxylase-like n=1 Tax=Ornithodoros turicata TaxID=34597 RepID=UPI0031397018